MARVDGKIGDSGAKKYWYVTDHVGSIRAITDKDGKKVWSADYLAFGKQYIKDGDFEELHSFTGKEYDPDTGLHYYNARWYDSDLGRFISEDPVADPNNPNLYSYGANNPLRFTDPTGLHVDNTDYDISYPDAFFDDPSSQPGYVSDGPDGGWDPTSDSSSDSSSDNNKKDEKKDEAKKENDKPNVEKGKTETEKQLEMERERCKSIYESLRIQYEITKDPNLLGEMAKYAQEIVNINFTLSLSDKKFDYKWTGKNVTPEFKSKVIEISNKLGMDPDDLMAIMAFESGFDPFRSNKTSGATGLIQFMDFTAKDLGTTLEELAKMSAVDQLDYVYEYLKDYTGKMDDIGNAYMAVFMPIGIGKSGDFALGIKGSTDKVGNTTYGAVYSQNIGLDTNKDGKITKEEAVSFVEKTRDRYK